MNIDWTDLIERRNKWVAHNFPEEPIPNPGESKLGMVEECGELAHAHLKEIQNIRGDTEKHVADAKDAVGDLTVYLLGVLSFIGKVPRNLEDLGDERAEVALFELAACVGTLVNTPRPSVTLCEYVIESAMTYCRIRKWDYAQIVNDTWNEVEKRDWKAYPHDGLSIPEMPHGQT